MDIGTSVLFTMGTIRSTVNLKKLRHEYNEIHVYNYIYSNMQYAKSYI